ncbi:hypothetical protein HWV62_13301 [Athelia sp. TMB]|nr:hypothetical protein HWV62_13301 [Athelia sp. TMB]
MKDPVRTPRSRSHSQGQTTSAPTTVPSGSATTAAPQYREKGQPEASAQYREKGAPGHGTRERRRVPGHQEYEIIINRAPPQQQQRQPRSQLPVSFPTFVNQGTGGLSSAPILVQSQHRERHHHSSHHHSSNQHSNQHSSNHHSPNHHSSSHHHEHRTHHHRSRTSSQQPPATDDRAHEHRSRSRSRHRTHSGNAPPPPQYYQQQQQQQYQQQQQQYQQQPQQGEQGHRRPRTTSASRYMDHMPHAQHSPLPSTALLPQPAQREPPPMYPTQPSYVEPPSEPRRMRRQTLPGGQVLDQTYQYSNCSGRKRALFVGINYRGQPNELQGCVNDVKNMCKFMMNRYGYKQDNIVLLTDDSEHPRQQPTKKNIIDGMRWLVRGAKADDSLFFHLLTRADSGHGGQTRDLDGDEIDGYDEVIFPVDYLTAGHIVDDAVFDSCHSGTALDLDYLISFCACKDDQTSADTTENGVAVGAMSYAFMLSLRALS